MSELIAQAWHKARNAWMTQTRHGTQEQADAAAIEALTAALRAQAKEFAAQSPGLATTGTVNPAATTADAANDAAFGEFTIPTSGAIPEHGWRPVYLRAQAEQPAEPVALSTADVIIAILAVDREAARRGEMFPQTHDEQREDRRAVARVVGMLRWYQENTGCERIKGWPTATSRPDPRIAALEGLLREAISWIHKDASVRKRIEAALGGK